jgi:hypothetical protein
MGDRRGNECNNRSKKRLKVLEHPLNSMRIINSEKGARIL